MAAKRWQQAEKKMAKAKNLNGLPVNLALSYLSTLGYYDGGYMADWLNFIAREYD